MKAAEILGHRQKPNLIVAQKDLEAFKIKAHGKILDYRLGAVLELDKVRTFFERKYKVNDIWSNGSRHILGSVEHANKNLFLKLSTTEGVSAVTEIEYNWNEQFNKLVTRDSSHFWVPQNYDSGYYNNNLFYIVTDKFDGELLCALPGERKISDVFANSIPEVIEFSELIQALKIQNQSSQEDLNYIEWFIKKSKSWYVGIPEKVRGQYQIYDLLKIVENGSPSLQRKARHGDFAPWHLLRIKTGELGLIDGEHVMANGVEYYDIAYFIQRVFNQVQNPNLAEKIVNQLIGRGYEIDKLKVILAARGIGGFLDDSLTPAPDYSFSNKYKNWVINL